MTVDKHKRGYAFSGGVVMASRRELIGTIIDILDSDSVKTEWIAPLVEGIEALSLELKGVDAWGTNIVDLQNLQKATGDTRMNDYNPVNVDLDFLLQERRLGFAPLCEEDKQLLYEMSGKRD